MVTPGRDAEAEREFSIRVRPLLVTAVIWRDTDALQRRGCFFEAVDQHLNGYRVIGLPGEPSITWSLLESGSVQVTATPGQVTVAPVWTFDHAFAETVVAAWWDKLDL